MFEERNLWAAVVDRALEDLRSRDLYIRDSARGWFNTTLNKGVGSFIWVCVHLGLDPDYTRTQVSPAKRGIKRGRKRLPGQRLKRDYRKGRYEYV